jgi:hypothetical protein
MSADRKRKLAKRATRERKRAAQREKSAAMTRLPRGEIELVPGMMYCSPGFFALLGDDSEGAAGSAAAREAARAAGVFRPDRSRPAD